MTRPTFEAAIEFVESRRPAAGVALVDLVADMRAELARLEAVERPHKWKGANCEVCGQESYSPAAILPCRGPSQPAPSPEVGAVGKRNVYDLASETVDGCPHLTNIDGACINCVARLLTRLERTR